MNLDEGCIRYQCDIQHIVFCLKMEHIPSAIRSKIDNFEMIGWMITNQKNEDDVHCIYFVKISPNYTSYIDTAAIQTPERIFVPAISYVIINL